MYAHSGMVCQFTNGVFNYQKSIKRRITNYKRDALTLDVSTFREEINRKVNNLTILLFLISCV